MSGIIKGYSYDIFISYRQNDNKYDGWVTEFVDNLSKELEANIKDKISVYFDINPKDGLLETDLVDKSLEDKLKCLIFIPIISRTYCDSKSYAWQHEFCAFNKLAKEDLFGRDIKLNSGNVASRILPVKIHDLDPEDKSLLENELGGMLRGIEFIYKEAGVDRPLTVKDNEEKNLHKTSYRNQINKVALAIKEILSAIKHKEQKPEPTSAELYGSTSPPPKKNRIKILTGSFIVLLLIILGIIFIPKLTKQKEHLEKSIAVLPFINDSPDSNEENIPFINGLMEEILINLQTIKGFRVPGRTSVEQFRNNTTRSIPEIAKQLGVNYIVEGSGQKYGNTLRLRVQLIRARGKEAHLWAKSYEQEIQDTKDIFNLQSQIAQAIAAELKATISPDEKQKLEKTPKANLAAYEAYLKGLFFYEKDDMKVNEKAIYWFSESIKLDSTFALAWTYLSMCHWRKSETADTFEFKESKHIAERALELDPNSSISIVNLAEIFDNEYDFKEAQEKIKLALEIDPNNQYVLRNACRLYTKLGKGNESISFCNDALQIEPNNPTALEYLALGYFYAGRYTEASATLKKCQELEIKVSSLKRLYYQILLEEGSYERIINEPSYEGDEDAKNVAIAAANFALGHKNIAENLCINLIGKNAGAFWIAYAYTFGNEPLKVYEWLEKSYILKERELTYLGVEPAFERYRNDPRVKKLLQKIGFQS